MENEKKGIHMLVVDDERDIELLFRQRFRKEIRAGEVYLDFALSGEEALDFLSERPADVVLSDINMPGMNGLELLSHIKSMPPPPLLPVCMMTAYANADFRERAEQLGCDDYLTKPLDFTDLKQRIYRFRDSPS